MPCSIRIVVGELLLMLMLLLPEHEPVVPGVVARVLLALLLELERMVVHLQPRVRLP